MEKRLHTCMLCEAACGLEVTVHEQKVQSIRGDQQDPFSRGHVCPKAAAISDLQNDPDRITQPMRRIGNRFEPVSWDEALAEAGQRIADLQRTHGRSAVGFYQGNPTVHSYTAVLGSVLFGKLLGTRSRFSATSVDQLPQMLAALEMFGHQLLIPVPDIDRTSHLFVLGANPAVSNGSLMTAPGVVDRLKALRARGGKLIVVDPRKSETAALADEHHFIRPGGDAFLLLAMLQTLFAEGLVDPGLLLPHMRGLATLRSFVEPFTPEKVANRTGIAPDVVRSLARNFARAPSAAAYGRVGLCTQEFGGSAAWLLNALNLITGNVDHVGGLLFTTPAADLLRFTTLLGETGHFDIWRSRVRNLPEFSGELPAVTMAEEIETEGKGQIKGLITLCGNPVLSVPNGKRLEKAISKLDYYVAIDLYLNETTRHANLLLPTSFGFEREHYDLALYTFSVQNAARYAEPIVPAPPGVRHDWEVLLDLGLSLDAHGGGKQSTKWRWISKALRTASPSALLDALLRFGPHRLSLAKLRENPHGMVLGPLKPQLPKLLSQGHGHIQLAPARYATEKQRLLDALEAPSASDHLVLIGRRSLRSNNSWMHNSRRLVKGPVQCTLQMNSADAHQRGLTDGKPVALSSEQGTVEVPLEITDEMAPGVVSMPHGWGHHTNRAQLSVAGERPGESCNDVTDERFVDPFSGTAALSGLHVQVKRIEAETVIAPATAEN